MLEKDILDRPFETGASTQSRRPAPYFVFLLSATILAAISVLYTEFADRWSLEENGPTQWILINRARLYAALCLFFSVTYRILPRRYLHPLFTGFHIALVLLSFAVSLALWNWRSPPAASSHLFYGFGTGNLAERLTHSMFIYPELQYLTFFYLIGWVSWAANVGNGIYRWAVASLKR